MGDPDVVNITLKKGVHTIRFYAPNNGGWINYDYFEIISGDDTTKADVQAWIDAYLKFDTIDIEDKGTGLCVNYYASTKAALLALDEGEPTWSHVKCFTNEENTEFANAKARYEAWAFANNDTQPYGDSGVLPSYSVTPSSTSLQLLEASNNTIMVVVVVSLGSLSVFCFLIKKKRKSF